MMSKLSSTIYTIIGGVAVSGAAYLIYRQILKEQNVNQTSLSKIDSNQNGARDSADQNKVLFLGLDGSGKSSILASLTSQPQENTFEPTEGFNVMCIQTTEVPLNVWEIGGAKNMREYWKYFLKDINVLVYVIDGSDLERFGEAVVALKTLLSNDNVKQNPVYIIINKADLCSTEVCQSMYNRILDEVPELRSPASVSYTITQVPRQGTHQGIEDLKKNLQKMVS